MFLSINTKTSSAVTYPGPSDSFGHTLTFKINSCQLPSNQTFYVLFDAGNFIVKCMCTTGCMCWEGVCTDLLNLFIITIDDNSRKLLCQHYLYLTIILDIGCADYYNNNGHK